MLVSRFFMRIKKYSLYLIWELRFGGELIIEIPFLFDKFRLGFGGTVRFIAFCVFNFSESYMNNDKYYIRFHMVVFSFVLSIMLLIFRPRIIRVFLGWDGLGVTSYFLVIYFERAKSFGAGILTALRNRVGDVIYLLRLFFYRNISSWNFFLWSEFIDRESCKILLLVLIIGGITKSAQLPFSAWLPAAMAAPTPVSALVHSSTLVTAGVYVLFRIREILKQRVLREILFYLGRVTILLAGFRALREIDAKKIVALSTLRQLGIIMMSIGSGNYELGFFHLLSHAFFKALLFIVVGNFIHLSNSYQDLRKISCQNLVSPECALIGRIRNIRLIGMPFLSGFYSKDLCIEIRLAYRQNRLRDLIFLGGIALTVLYSLRFRHIVFSLNNHQFRLWSAEKRHYRIKGRYYLLGLAVRGRSIYLWILFERTIFFLDSFNKIIILLILGLSVIVGFALHIKKTELRYIEGFFYIWNLSFISRFILNKAFFFLGKSNIKNREIAWSRFLSWSFTGLRIYIKRNNFERKLIYKNIVLILIGVILYLII